MAEIREWQIERFVLGELPGAEQQAVARAIAEDPALRARVAAIEASNREILAAHPPRVAASVIRDRIAAPPPPTAAWGRRVAFAAAASRPGTRRETASTRAALWAFIGGHPC